MANQVNGVGGVRDNDESLPPLTPGTLQQTNANTWQFMGGVDPSAADQSAATPAQAAARVITIESQTNPGDALLAQMKGDPQAAELVAQAALASQNPGLTSAGIGPNDPVPTNAVFQMPGGDSLKAMLSLMATPENMEKLRSTLQQQQQTDSSTGKPHSKTIGNIASIGLSIPIGD